MELIADLHLHSKYARAVSKYMELPAMGAAAARKGIDLITTGDWQHPAWFSSIEQELEEVSPGILRLRQGNLPVQFMLVSEISCIYRQDEKLRRVHHLIFSPSLAVCRKVIAALQKAGANLLEDGRPIVKMTSPQLLELLLECDERCLLIPAHVWTPWFGMYGSKTGFTSIEECFGEYSKYIYGIETGLSSDPVMNWQVGELDSRSILSFSDAHSAAKMGREATVFSLPHAQVTYDDIADAIKQTGKSVIAYTIEFFPEEGKYHWTGHRACGVRYSPEEERAKGIMCPVCGKPLTSGVSHRVGELSNRFFDAPLPAEVITEGALRLQHPERTRPPFVSVVPLQEIIHEVITSPTKSQREYERVISLASEFDILLKMPSDQLRQVVGEEVARSIENMRQRKVQVDPGYDGVFGTVRVR